MRRSDVDMTIYISAIAVAVGVFLPLTRLPFYGIVSYNRIAEVESLLVMVFAISAPSLLLLKKKQYLLYPPLAIWLTLLYPTILGRLTAKKGGNFFDRIGMHASSTLDDFKTDLLLNVSDFRWGGLILLLGLLAFTAGCVLRTTKR